jgi:hypothetical protein
VAASLGEIYYELVMLSEAQHLYRFIRAVQRSGRDASTSLRFAQHDERNIFTIN